jgi:hypothetical protein
VRGSPAALLLVFLATGAGGAANPDAPVTEPADPCSAFTWDVTHERALFRAPIPSRNFLGRAGCPEPHKVVEFELPSSTPLTLQFSAGDAPMLRVAVLMAPPSREPR